MLEVHPPETRIHGVGEFFLHLFTITVGLLIALGLENAAGAVHHRHQREEAETRIRRELQENRQHLAKSETAVQSELNNLRAALGYLQARSEKKDVPTAQISPGFNMVHLQNAGWRTANATGVVQYMHYDDVQKLANVYDLQDVFNGLQNETLDNFMKLDSYIAANKDSKSLTPQEVDSAMLDVRTTMAHLGALRDVSGGLLKSYDEALK